MVNKEKLTGMRLKRDELKSKLTQPNFWLKNFALFVRLFGFILSHLEFHEAKIYGLAYK